MPGFNIPDTLSAAPGETDSLWIHFIAMPNGYPFEMNSFTYQSSTVQNPITIVNQCGDISINFSKGKVLGDPVAYLSFDYSNESIIFAPTFENAFDIDGDSLIGITAWGVTILVGLADYNDSTIGFDAFSI